MPTFEDPHRMPMSWRKRLEVSPMRPGSIDTRHDIYEVFGSLHHNVVAGPAVVAAVRGLAPSTRPVRCHRRR